VSITIEDKVALVTGGARGIGLSIAERFLEAGAKVVIGDYNEQSLNDALASLQSAHGDRVRGTVADVSEEEDVKRMVGLAIQEFGAVDILVNNAGIGGMNYVWDMPAEEWDAVIAVNLRGPYLCTKEAAAAMIQRGRGGRIINIASVNSIAPTTGITHYCASKGGLLMFTRTAALELGPRGININAIGPGSTMTPLTEGFFSLPGLAEGFLDRTPLGRFGRPEDIAKVALFLASEYADWVTGQIIYVDGGQSLMGLPRYLEGIKEAEGLLGL
jgi:NAD(P)-dependent dehydrogenase (short-subunit alcohol dehydrogenase family)